MTPSALTVVGSGYGEVKPSRCYGLSCNRKLATAGPPHLSFDAASRIVCNWRSETRQGRHRRAARRDLSGNRGKRRLFSPSGAAVPALELPHYIDQDSSMAGGIQLPMNLDHPPES